MSANNIPYYATLIVTSSGVEQITEVKQEAGELKVVMGEIGETTERATAASSRAMSRFLFTIQISLFYFSMWTSALDSVRTSQLSLQTAQERHIETIRKYGVDSMEAVRSSRQLEKAQIALSRSSRLLFLNMAGLAFQVGNLGIEIVTMARRLGWLKTTIDAVTVSHWLETAAVKAKAVAYAILNAVMANPVPLAILLAGTAATAGILATSMGQSTAATPSETNITVEGSEFNVTDGEAAIEEDARQKLEQLRRIR